VRSVASLLPQDCRGSDIVEGAAYRLYRLLRGRIGGSCKMLCELLSEGLRGVDCDAVCGGDVSSVVRVVSDRGECSPREYWRRVYQRARERGLTREQMLRLRILEAAYYARVNIMLVGPPGSGKTTLLKTLQDRCTVNLSLALHDRRSFAERVVSNVKQLDELGVIVVDELLEGDVNTVRLLIHLIDDGLISLRYRNDVVTVQLSRRPWVVTAGLIEGLRHRRSPVWRAVINRFLPLPMPQLDAERLAAESYGVDVDAVRRYVATVAQYAELSPRMLDLVARLVSALGQLSDLDLL